MEIKNDKLKFFGEIIAQENGRKIIRLLLNKKHYTNEIVLALDLRTALVSHYLKKLEKIGILDITEEKIIKNGVLHKFYKINSDKVLVYLDNSIN